MRFFCFVIIIFSFSVGYAQTDSLITRGGDYLRNRDFTQAELCFKKAFKTSINETQKGRILNNLAVVQLLRKDYNQALVYFSKAEKIYHLIGEKDLLAGTYNNIGATYEKMDDLDAALSFYKKAFRLRSGNKISILNNIAKINSKKDPVFGISIYKHLLEDSPDYYPLRQNLAKLYAKTNQINLAVKEYELALKYHASLSSPVFIELKKELANMLYNAGIYNQAQSNYVDAIFAYERLRNLYLIDKTKINSTEANKNLYLSAIECAVKGNRPDEAFALMEKLKAPVLAEKIRLNSLSDTIRVQMKEIDLRIEKSLTNNYKDLDEIINEKSVLMDLYANITTLPSQVLKNLPADIAVLNYTYSDSLLVRLITHKNKTTCDIVPIDSTFVSHMLNYHFIIADQNRTSYEDYTSYFTSSKYLCSKLLPNFSEEVTRLQIVPYKYLYLVPFHCLTKSDMHTDWASFYDIHFLIEDYAISYSPSIDVIQEQKQSNTKAIAFVPNYTRKKLEHSMDEAHALKKHFNTDILSGTHATRENFFKHLPEHDIISVISHGKNGRILLENDTIRAEELYPLNLDNNLTVLSACQSNAGKLESAEGFMSLARKFLELGSKSVVASVWVANDKITSDIMSDFYWYTSEGNSKDVALQKATINHLNNAESVFRAPCNWASLVLMGNVESLPPSRRQFLWFFLLLVLLPFVKYFKRRT
ncbi:MAG: CHAT domain-containing protein [Marinifilum sp.]|jgi:CHAT domain-containing protein/Tfp pilus assembly protein PilF|nr:CHAT domain-containing protein [Marinifilum sp.]